MFRYTHFPLHSFHWCVQAILPCAMRCFCFRRQTLNQPTPSGCCYLKAASSSVGMLCPPVVFVLLVEETVSARWRENSSFFVQLQACIKPHWMATSKRCVFSAYFSVWDQALRFLSELSCLCWKGPSGVFCSSETGSSLAGFDWEWLALFLRLVVSRRKEDLSVVEGQLSSDQGPLEMVDEFP